MKGILWSVILLYTLVLPVSAHAVPDPERQGSISITMRYLGNPVPGGELTLYRVGDIAETDGNYSFIPTTQFQPSNVSFEKVHAYETAKKLSSFAKEHKLLGETRKISTKGAVTFDDLRPGLYLLVQNKAAEGYYAVNSFLVSLPMPEKDAYSYHVDASPKVSPMPVVPPQNPEQPKTGQSGWPIWTFLLSGAALTVLLYREKAR